MKVSTSTIGSRWHRPCPHCEGSFVRGQRFASCSQCDTRHHVRCAREAQTCKADDCTPPVDDQDSRVNSGRLRAIRKEIRKHETKRINRRKAFPGACARVKQRAHRLRTWSARAGARSVVLMLIAAAFLLLEYVPLFSSFDGPKSSDRTPGIVLIVVAVALLGLIFVDLNRGGPKLDA